MYPGYSPPGRLLLLIYVLTHDHVSEHVVADSHHAVQLQRNIGAGFEVHQNINAFALLFDWVGQSPAALFKLSGVSDNSAHVSDYFLVFLKNRIEQFFRQLGVDNVHRLVVAQISSPPLGLWLRISRSRKE